MAASTDAAAILQRIETDEAFAKRIERWNETAAALAFVRARPLR